MSDHTRKPRKPTVRPRKLASFAADGVKEQNKQLSLHESLEAFDEFTTVFTPAMQKMLKDGKTDDAALRKKFLTYVQARQIQTALLSDPIKVQAIMKDIIDREKGKPVERKQVEHKMAHLSDNELDAVLKTELLDAGLDDGTEK